MKRRIAQGPAHRDLECADTLIELSTVQASCHVSKNMKKCISIAHCLNHITIPLRVDWIRFTRFLHGIFVSDIPNILQVLSFMLHQRFIRTLRRLFDPALMRRAINSFLVSDDRNIYASQQIYNAVSWLSVFLIQSMLG